MKSIQDFLVNSQIDSSELNEDVSKDLGKDLSKDELEDKLYDLCWEITQNRPKKAACDVFGQKLKVNDIVVMFKNDNSAAFHTGNIVEFGFINKIDGDKLTIYYPSNKWGSDFDEYKFHYDDCHKYTYEVVKVNSKFYKNFIK